MGFGFNETYKRSYFFCVHSSTEDAFGNALKSCWENMDHQVLTPCQPVRDVTKAKTGRTKRRDFSLTKLNVNKNPALYYQNAKKKKNQLHCKSQCPF